MPTNAFGEEITDERTTDIWYVKPEDRQDDDSGPGSNALEGGDDLDGWTPEDFYAEHPEQRPEPVDAGEEE